MAWLDQSSILRRVGFSALALLFIASTATAVVLVQEALEERENATAAADLRLAVLTVASTNDTSDLDNAERQAFDEAMALLGQSNEATLHPLPVEERAFTRSELDELRRHGELARDAELSAGHVPGADHADHGEHDIVHSLVAHDDLQASLRNASVAAGEAAAFSERVAAIAGLAAALLVAAMTVLAVRSNRQASAVAVQSEAYRDAASRLGALLDHSPIATVVIGSDDAILYASRAAQGLTDRLPSSGSGLARIVMGRDAQPLADILATSSEAELQIVSHLEDKDLQTRREFLVHATNMQDDPVVQGTFVTFTETTSDNHARRQLEYLAEHDQLTGLPNRRALTTRLRGLGAGDALLMIDLDGFKQTNDTYGHAAGDELLIAVARRFVGALRPGDNVYRLGGDEFAVVARGGIDHARDLAERLRRTLDDPVQLTVGFERIAASIGVADHGASQLSILRRADIALYDAKANGGNRVEVLSDDLEARSVWLSQVARSLELAQLDYEFHLVVQPIVDATTHEVKMLEALLRWQSPELGMVPPDAFITLAEESGKINEIGDWVLDNAVAALSRIRSAGICEGVAMTINVSPVQLSQPGFADRARRVLAEHALDPSLLTIELTESAVVTGAAQILEQLHQLRELGCRIACDDFGSGYSNLGQLMAMPLDMIKVDRSLLNQLTEMRAQLGDSPEMPCQVMTAIVTIGSAMDAITVGEGIETAQQAASLRDSGVQLLQGYHFGRPMEIEDFIESRSAVAMSTLA